MKKMKKAFSIITVLMLMLILLVNQQVFASNVEDLIPEEVEYSEEFQRWLELSDEEKQNVIQPRMYDVLNTNATSKSPFFRLKALKSSVVSRYSLKDVIPSNLIIKDQKNTGACWTFAGLSSLETNLAMADYKNGVNISKVYDFSERHMEYATSKVFANNVQNEIGYNRKVGDGGSWYLIESYLTNGTGAINEPEMPFENNENIINISKIQNKTVSSQVYDTVRFADYQDGTALEKTEIMNQIKQHIQNYGAVYAMIHGDNSTSSDCDCYNGNTAAKFCANSTQHEADHAISIIGWDDNYSINNFSSKSRPTANGAWIVRNSWGQSAGDNGLIYVSYEDCNISYNMNGIIKASDTIDYENIYQYDLYSPALWQGIGASNSQITLCNIFDKKTTGSEYLTQVAIDAAETYTCRVYVNPNGTSTEKEDLQFVPLKAGESETFNAGYHTLEFAKPIEIKGNSFAVVIQVQGTRTDENKIYVSLESKMDDVPELDYVTVESGKCFISAGNDIEDLYWHDLSNLWDISADSSIKAFTVFEIEDDSLKNIEIVTPPNKTSYFEGENFDKTGMVVKANYNNNTSTILDNSSYSITNGTSLQVGQTSVTITFEDKSVEQAISVEKNVITELKIKTHPTKTEYIEGQSFDKTGMVVEATYKDGTTKTITNYTIENGNNLTTNQTQVTISFEDKTVEQAITVVANSLEKIVVSKVPNKVNYVEGQNFDKTGMVVTGTYKDGTSKEITDYTVENGTNLKKSQTSVTIKYGDKTVTQAITVEEKVITSISIDKMPSKLTYIKGKENLDLTSGSIKITYNDGTAENIEMTSDKISVTGFNNTNTGKITITIKYQSKTTQFEVEIIEDKVVTEKVVTEISIENMPSKLTYIKNKENLDLTGGSIKITYNDGTTQTIEMTSAQISVTGFNNTNIGKITIVINYQSKTTQFEVEIVEDTVVTEKVITEISIENMPSKLTYIKGIENLDLTGGSIKITYNDGTTETIEMTSDQISVTGFDNINTGKITIVVNYQSKITQFEVEIVEENEQKEVNSNTEDSNTESSNTQNSNSDNSNETENNVTGAYQGAANQQSVDYTIESSNNSDKKTTYVITKNEVTTKSTTSEEKVIQNISVYKMPSKLTYIKDKENLDLTGGSLKITYNNGSTQSIKMTSEGVTVTGFDNTKLGKVTITVNYQSKNTQFEVEIVEDKAENSNLNKTTSNVKNIKAYYFTDNSQEDYTVITVEVNNIEKNVNNDSVEYYYYLSSNANEQNINNWTPIAKLQNSNGKLQFTIDSREVSNYDEISKEYSVYLYIKEVAIKGGSQSVSISKAMKLETNKDVETYINNIKEEEVESSNSITNNSEESTISIEESSSTSGSLIVVILIIIMIVIVIGVGIYLYMKYRS